MFYLLRFFFIKINVKDKLYLVRGRINSGQIENAHLVHKIIVKRLSVLHLGSPFVLWK